MAAYWFTICLQVRHSQKRPRLAQMGASAYRVRALMDPAKTLAGLENGTDDDRVRDVPRLDCGHDEFAARWRRAGRQIVAEPALAWSRQQWCCCGDLSWALPLAIRTVVGRRMDQVFDNFISAFGRTCLTVAETAPKQLAQSWSEGGQRGPFRLTTRAKRRASCSLVRAMQQHPRRSGPAGIRDRRRGLWFHHR